MRIPVLVALMMAAPLAWASDHGYVRTCIAGHQQLVSGASSQTKLQSLLNDICACQWRQIQASKIDATTIQTYVQAAKSLPRVSNDPKVRKATEQINAILRKAESEGRCPKLF